MTRVRAAAALALVIAAPAAGAAQSSLAQCLADRGFVMYGASWCPYCREQKRVFGNDAKNLPYVECSADDVPHGRSTRICETKGIDVYPTWRFADGMLHEGIRSRKQLAELSGCSLD